MLLSKTRHENEMSWLIEAATISDIEEFKFSRFSDIRYISLHVTRVLSDACNAFILHFSTSRRVVKKGRRGYRLFFSPHSLALRPRASRGA